MTKLVLAVVVVIATVATVNPIMAKSKQAVSMTASIFAQTGRHGLSSDKGNVVCAIEDTPLRKWPSDLAPFVDTIGSFGAVFATDWCGTVADATADVNWFQVNLNGKQQGWTKASSLRLKGPVLSSTKSGGGSLRADRYLIVVALDTATLVKSPSFTAASVDANGSYGSILPAGWTGKIINTSLRGSWCEIDLNGHQTGWVRSEYLKVVAQDATGKVR